MTAPDAPPRRPLADLPRCARTQRGFGSTPDPAPGPRLDWSCNWECMGHPDTQVAIRLHRIEERERAASPWWRRWFTRRPVFSPYPAGTEETNR